ncbi:MAG: hypothetical protein ABEJ31_05195 [Haloarculaceae archaeon]
MSEDEDAADADAEIPDEYDPTSPNVPPKQPPLRSTAPQSPYTMGQVGFGVVVLLVGLALTFGIAFAV